MSRDVVTVIADLLSVWMFSVPAYHPCLPPPAYRLCLPPLPNVPAYACEFCLPLLTRVGFAWPCLTVIADLYLSGRITLSYGDHHDYHKTKTNVLYTMNRLLTEGSVRVHGFFFFFNSVGHLSLMLMLLLEAFYSTYWPFVPHAAEMFYCCFRSFRYCCYSKVHMKPLSLLSGGPLLWFFFRSFCRCCY